MTIIPMSDRSVTPSAASRIAAIAMDGFNQGIETAAQIIEACVDEQSWEAAAALIRDRGAVIAATLETQLHRASDT